MAQKVLSYDLGGTKVAVGVVTPRGKILEEIREPVVLQAGKEAVLDQLVRLGASFLKKYPEIEKVGVASAGPLDPYKGVLLAPSNFVSAKGSWGKVPITQILKKRLRRTIFLENDAAAAALAEHWVGGGKKYKNVMVLTLGTGLGTGIICNGELVRSGQLLHPEGGHMILKWNDQTAPCGCGNLGCAEAYLSGMNFGRRARTRFANPKLSSKEIADLARRGDSRALAAFAEYSEIMAIAIQNYMRFYSPEVIIFTGSFANTSDLFLKHTENNLKRILNRQKNGLEFMPKLTVSKLNNDAGIIGGAYIALHRKIRT